MALSPGDRLGSHEIIGLLGAGGMGEVYRAQDTRLNRQVAIKVLPEAHVGDPERIARFQREAQAVAALNHANIAGIFEFADSGDIKFLVLELIEGDTLAERIRRAPIPIDEALVISKQILEALEAAHERGICHRDLKPANVKLMPSRGGSSESPTVKVLDFGLAKFLQGGSAAPNLTQSPTLSLAGTYPGMILGTAGYMSPEQAKGFEADQRSDIFSFGCVLYELLTGRRAFEGDTASEILASVLKLEPDYSALPPRLNPRLVETLSRCLEKNPKKRWHAAADVRVELELVTGRAIVIDGPTAVIQAVSRPFWKRALSVTAGVLAGALIAGYAVWTLKPEPARSITRFAINLPSDQTLTGTGRQLVALSPDGTNLVYVANQRLFVRRLSGLSSQAIVGSDIGNSGVLHPAFSPDGQSLVFYANSDRTLKRLALSGGAAVTICSAEPIYGLIWDEQGIVFGQLGKGIFRVSPNGGVPELIAAVEPDFVPSSPHMLPGGRAVLFSVKRRSEAWDKAQIDVQPLDGGPRKTLVNGGSDGRYVPTGHLVYALSGVLFAIPFDVEALAVAGGPVPIVEGVRRGGATGAIPGTAQFSFAKDGSLAYLPGPAVLSGTADGVDLVLVDRKGVGQPLKLPPGAYRSPRGSPDGKSVTFDSEDEGDGVVWVYDLDGSSAVRRLTFGGRNRAPIWSADGQRIAFQSDRDGDLAIFWQRADGTGTAERLTKPEKGTSHMPQSWSPDGQHLLYTIQTAESQFSLWSMTMKDRQMAPFGNVQSQRAPEADFSPDGRWVAYYSREAGTNQIYVQPFPSTGTKYLVPTPGGAGAPRWSAKGDELTFNINQTSNVTVTFSSTPRVSFGQPREFVRRIYSEGNPTVTRRNVDVLPDGEHIIGVMSRAAAAQPDTAASPPQINVVLNWFDEVRQRVPKN